MLVVHTTMRRWLRPTEPHRDGQEIEVVGAQALGWMRRRDLGPAFWEMPDGRLYHHCDEAEPLVECLKGEV